MWEELYERYRGELVRYAARLCGSGEEAEDLVQEVFLRALQNVDTVLDLGPNQKRAWLYRALKNLFYDRYRRERLESAYLDSLPEDGAYWDPGLQETENRILLAQLSPEDRMLFHLRYEEGYNASELSEMFHIPKGTIRSRLSRMRGLLKEMLE